MPKRNLPTYRLHKPSGRAVVTLDGKDYYLGRHGSKASREEYERILADYLANGKKLPPTQAKTGILIEELCIRFLEWAEKYYRKNGKVTKSFHFAQKAVSLLVKHYGNLSVNDFSPLSLVFLQEKWVECGLARKTVNENVRVIRQAFRYGLKFGWVSADTYLAIQSVDSLKEGRTTAPEYEAIEPVADEIVEKTLQYLQPTTADMVRVQRLAGMRPQEVRNMKLCNIDRTGDVWKYKPFTHKTEHHGKKRELAIGPRAQAILTPYMIDKQDDPESFLFSPADSEVARSLERRRMRKSKITPSQQQRDAERKENPKRIYSKQYSADAYRRAIERACLKAGVEIWCPNQLRHSAGTEVRDKYGLEHAQAVLGHSNANTTEIYAKVNFEKAAQVAREIG